MLIHNAEIDGRDAVDLRVLDGVIAAMGKLQPRHGETVIDAGGNLLLPGLHDHHIHLYAYAAARASVPVGPPDVSTESELVEALNTSQGNGWLRGVGYHDSVAGEIDRLWLDEHGPDRPVRLQHRSGRLWMLNTKALQLLGITDVADGRLFDRDELLHRNQTTSAPDIATASAALASYGVTGLTDMTPSNNTQTHERFADHQSKGELRQRFMLAGRQGKIVLTKFHLHDSNLPIHDDFCADIARSHSRRRPVAVHCVTELALVFTLAALERVGTQAGDRIEHASVVPPALLEQLREAGVIVVTQPNFVGERGDHYIAEMPDASHDWLYRGRAFLDEGIPLAAGTDAPFGHANPWLAMDAAVRRATALGKTLGAREAITPEEAVALFTGPLEAPGKLRHLRIGAPADLCLIDRPWSAARNNLADVKVRMTAVGGEPVFLSQPGVH